MDNITKAALLLNAVRSPNKIFTRLCNDYDPAELWQSETLPKELGLNERMCERLSEFIAKDWAEREEDKLYQFGAKFISSKNLDYPARLLELPKPPVGLYVKGVVNLSLPSVAIVGTRKCSAYAEDKAMKLGEALARAGVMTISGGARGIDSAGHRGSLAGNGVTVVIFGTGLDKTYPAENKDLFAQILERGAWVSEYHFGEHGTIWSFPQRDKIIAAIAAHVVLGESPENGGAMHTARTAKNLRRDTWSLPGNIDKTSNYGSNKILNEGVKCLASISDFLKHVTAGKSQAVIDFETGNNSPGHESSAPSLDDNDKAVYSLLQRLGAKTDDEIVAESGLDFSDVGMSLMTLEAEGLIRNIGGRYSAV